MLLSQLQGAENTAKPKTVIPAKFNPKSLTQLAAEKIKQSIRKPAAKTVRNKIKYFEKLSVSHVLSLQDMRDEKLANAKVSKYMKDFSFQNLFEQRLNDMPGKREKVQITIHAEIGHTLGNRTEFIDKTYGPFKMEIPKLSKSDMYKFVMYTLLKNNFTVLSTETISKIGAKITT